MNHIVRFCSFKFSFRARLLCLGQHPNSFTATLDILRYQDESAKVTDKALCERRCHDQTDQLTYLFRIFADRMKIRAYL